jgi:hypothetical protein
VSVDTYLKGKDTRSYQRVTPQEHADVEVLVSPTMGGFSRRVSVDTKAGLFGRRLDVEVEHEHGPACRH